MNLLFFERFNLGKEVRWLFWGHLCSKYIAFFEAALCSSKNLLEPKIKPPCLYEYQRFVGFYYTQNVNLCVKDDIHEYVSDCKKTFDFPFISLRLNMSKGFFPILYLTTSHDNVFHLILWIIMSRRKKNLILLKRRRKSSNEH